MDEETKKSLATLIAEELGETETDPVRQIEQVVQHFGEDFANQLMNQVREIEAAGGQLTKQGDRRRTPGGVFLNLARKSATTPKQKKIFYPANVPAAKPVESIESTAFKWSQITEICQKLVSGVASTVKITLIGRPDNVETRQNLAIISLSYTPKNNIPLPKGVPPLESKPTNYLVFIASKQWAKVADAIKNPNDSLIIEGIPTMTGGLPMVVVHATSVTTKELQKAKKQPSES